MRSYLRFFYGLRAPRFQAALVACGWGFLGALFVWNSWRTSTLTGVIGSLIVALAYGPWIFFMAWMNQRQNEYLFAGSAGYERRRADAYEREGSQGRV